MQSVKHRPIALRVRRCASVFVRALAVVCLWAGLPAHAQTADLVSKAAFRVCADPANSPFSNTDGTGFENRIAELFAGQMDLPLEYMWFPMATGFIRRTLRENRCDVIIGYAQGHELVLNTNHYYTSAYVVVIRTDSDLAGIDSISDPRLKGRATGVIAGTPPATHMARYGMMSLAKGYQLMVDRRHYSPNEDMIDDLQNGVIDAAFIWGPIAGSLVKASDGKLTMTPLLKEMPQPRMFFRITMGVRQGELVWKRKLNSMIRKNQTEIDQILSGYSVPLLNDMGVQLKVALE